MTEKKTEAPNISPDFDPYLDSRTILRTPTAICFPANCGFTVIGRFSRFKTKVTQDVEAWKKEVLEQCDLPPEKYFNKPPAGSFVSVNGYQKLEKKALEEIGFVPLLENIPNPNLSSTSSLYYRPHPDSEAKRANKQKAKPLF